MTDVCLTRRLLSHLAMRLGCDRPLVALDLETTGTVVETDRIVEIALVRWQPDGELTVREEVVNPGVPIPSEVTAIHGITDAQVANAPPFAGIAPDIATVLEGADLLGYNIRRFDGPLLEAEFKRAGIAWSLDGRRLLDPLVIYRRREPRDLASAVRHYCGVRFSGHRALADAEAAMTVLVAQFGMYGDLPATVGELADYCLDRDPSWVDGHGKIVWRGREAIWNVGKNAGRSLRELAQRDPGFLRWVLERDFSAEVKHICRRALGGYWPIHPLDQAECAAGRHDVLPGSFGMAGGSASCRRCGARWTTGGERD